MHYAILCYDSEEAVFAWTPEKDAQVMRDLGEVTQQIAARRQLGPVARLMPTTSAVTLRKGKDAMVVDGPFAETKEQLLGFYIVDVPSLDDAVAAARDLAAASGSAGAFEIRPLLYYQGQTE